MKTASYTDITKAIYGTLEGKSGDDLERAVKNVVSFIHRRRLLGESDSILSRLEKMTDEKERKIRVKVSSARKLSPENKHRLEDMLKKRYSAERIDFNEMIDEKLLGGWKVEAGDEVIDGTIRGKMRKLQEYLTR